MMEETIENQPQEEASQAIPKVKLENSTSILVLGILSIFGCWFGIGLIFSILALIMAKNAQKFYDQQVGKYTEASYKNKELGKICAITGVSLSGIYILAWLIKLILNGIH